MKSLARTTRIILVLLTTTLLLACSGTSIKNTWLEPGAPAKVYHKLLIVAIANDSNVRILFENILSDTLRQHGVGAVASYKLIPDLKKADRELLQETALREGVDGVVITRGLSKSERTNYQYATGTLQWRGMVAQNNTPDSSTTIIMSAVGIAPHETDYELASLETRFFDSASAKLVWSALSDTSEPGDRPGACWKLSALLVKSLSKDGLIVINDKPFGQPSL